MHLSMPASRGFARQASSLARPETTLDAETLDLIQLDVGVLRLRDGGAGDPPVGTGQSGGQISSRSWLSMLLGTAGMRNDFAMSGLP